MELGEGSMGAVWLAYSEGARGHCAVKVLHLAERKRNSAERSFNREVRAMARLDHEAVIRILDYGRTPKGSPFLAMEYVPGVSLSRYVHAPWSWPRLWTLLDSLLAGLAHAHARDLVHRDLKPGNVIIHPDSLTHGAVKIADFGIALAVHEAASSNRRVEGTPAYIAPEAASGDVASVGPWTDLYSLGVMLFEILTGERPFRGRNLLTHHQRSPLPPVSIRDEVDVPEGFVAIVERLLEKAPHARYRSAAEVRAALERLGPLPERQRLGDPPLTLLDDSISPGSRFALIPARGPSGPGLFHLREPPLAGRDRAREALEQSARLALSGSGPRVVILQGEAGLGKSRLAAWIREQVEESGHMRTLVVRSEPQTENGGGLRQGVLRFVGAPTSTRKDADQVLSVVLPDEESRANAIDVLWSDAPHHGPGSEVVISHAARLIRDLSGGEPMLLWIEDAQWSPEAKVLRLVDRLARPDGPSQLLVVITLRPSARSTVQSMLDRLRRNPAVREVDLHPISPTELAPALEALAPLPPGIADAACVQAAGNPLIALEAVRTYLESEGLGTAPTDPAQVLTERIKQATEGPGGGALKSTLARATLLGRSFTLQPLVKLCGVPGDPEAPALHLGGEESVAAAVDQAEENGLLIVQGAGRWRFSHDLVRAQFRNICRSLANWQALNLASAELKSPRGHADTTGIEMEMVARHYAEAGHMETALELGQISGRRLFDSGLMGHATSFLRKVLDWDRTTRRLTPQSRGELRLMCSEAAEYAGQPDEAELQARKALNLGVRTKAPAVAAQAASRLAVLSLHNDDSETAQTWVQKALKFAERSEEPLALYAAWYGMGELRRYDDQLDEAVEAYESALENARVGDLVGEALRARSAVAHIDRLQGRLERAETTFDAVAAGASEAGLEVLALTARLHLGLCAWAQEDALTARQAFSEVRQGARGNLFALELYACLGEAWSLAKDGDWENAEVLLLQAEDLRYDVRLHEVEAARLRASLKALARNAGRHGVLASLDRLEVVVTRTHTSTAHSEGS
ncbi:MAG: serine/threonine-protein kinase PknK [Bradymonadia bacterium]